MTLAEFKSENNIPSLKLFKSKTAGSKRLIGSVGALTFVTAETFVASQPIFVFPKEAVDKVTGEVNMIHWLTNKQPRDADLEL